MTARISPATAPFPDDVQAWLDRTMPPGKPPLVLFTTLARDPRLFGKFFRIAKAGLDQENSCVSSEESVGRKWIILRFFAVKPRPVWGNQSGHDRREIRLFDRGSFAGEITASTRSILASQPRPSVSASVYQAP